MWDLSSLTRDGTHTPCPGRWILNHWITRKSPMKHISVAHEWEEGWRRQKYRDQASLWSHMEKANKTWTWKSRIIQPADFMEDTFFRCSCYDKTLPLFPVLQQTLLAGRLLLNSISNSKVWGRVGAHVHTGSRRLHSRLWADVGFVLLFYFIILSCCMF